MICSVTQVVHKRLLTPDPAFHTLPCPDPKPPQSTRTPPSLQVAGCPFIVCCFLCISWARHRWKDTSQLLTNWWDVNPMTRQQGHVLH